MTLTKAKEQLTEMAKLQPENRQAINKALTMIDNLEGWMFAHISRDDCYPEYFVNLLGYSKAEAKSFCED